MLIRNVIVFVAMALVLSCDNSGNSPSIETSQYTYDHNGRLVSISYSNGAMVNYSYDSEGNVLTKVVQSLKPL